MTPEETKNLAEFEAHLISVHSLSVDLRKGDDGNYVVRENHLAFLAWTSARLLQAVRDRQVIEKLQAIFPRLCLPRTRHQCRICGTWIEIKEPCCRWRGFDSDGPFTSHAHPECYQLTLDMRWDSGDWETHSPGDFERPKKEETPSSSAQETDHKP